jgi:pyridoxamine 5'-phosphate oxidase
LRDSEVNAMTVSTIGSDGFPKARVVLLKNLMKKGLFLHHHYNCEKGKAITANPISAYRFCYCNMERQVVLKGI